MRRIFISIKSRFFHTAEQYISFGFIMYSIIAILVTYVIFIKDSLTLVDDIVGKGLIALNIFSGSINVRNFYLGRKSEGTLQPSAYSKNTR